MNSTLSQMECVALGHSMIVSSITLSYYTLLQYYTKGYKGNTRECTCSYDPLSSGVVASVPLFILAGKVGTKINFSLVRHEFSIRG